MSSKETTPESEPARYKLTGVYHPDKKINDVLKDRNLSFSEKLEILQKLNFIKDVSYPDTE